MRKSNFRENSVDCAISLPSLNGLPLPAVATDLDRRGAVVHLSNESRFDLALEPAALVEVRVGLPPVAGRSPRLLHCLGHVIHKSLDKRHQLWLVLRFAQICIRSQEDESDTEFGTGNGSASESRRGSRDSSIAVGGNRGTPQRQSDYNEGE